MILLSRQISVASAQLAAFARALFVRVIFHPEVIAVCRQRRLYVAPVGAGIFLTSGRYNRFPTPLPWFAGRSGFTPFATKNAPSHQDEQEALPREGIST